MAAGGFIKRNLCERRERTTKKHAAPETFLVAYFSAISFSFLYRIFNFVLQVCCCEVAKEQQTLQERSNYLKNNKNHKPPQRVT